MNFDESYWTHRYQQQQTGWDLGQVSPPLRHYIDQLKNKKLRILIPGSGNSYEAAYLHSLGFEQVYIADISKPPLQNFQSAHPDFPVQHILHQDFFSIQHTFDLVFEQTFFCALHPSQRSAYAQQVHSLLSPAGRLVGLLFDDPLFEDHPPFGGSRQEYRGLFEPYFEFCVFDTCYNSVPARQGRELFINLLRK